MARSTVAVISSMFLVGLLLGPLISLINFSGLSLSLSISDIAAIKFTFVQAAYSATLSTVLAIPVAKALLRQKFWGKSFVVLILGAPFILPVIVAVLGLILVFGNNGIVNNFLNLIGLGSIKIYGFWGVILAHVFFNLPLAIRILLQAFNDMPGEQYRLVSSLKLSSAQKFLVLEWPVLKKVCPGVWSVIFAICLSSFAVALTLGGGPRATTVELAIYQAFFYDLDFSKAAQLALIQIVLVFSVVFASQFIVKPKTIFGLDIKISTQNPSNFQKIMDTLVIIVTLLFIFIPILVIFFYGFANVFFLPSSVFKAASLSIQIAILSSFLSVFLGLCLTTNMGEMFGSLGIAISPIVMGAGTFLMLKNFGNPYLLAVPVTAIVNALVSLPFVIRILKPSAVEIRTEFENLSRSIGLTGIFWVWWVYLRRLKRQIGFSLGVASALSMGDLGVIVLFGSGEIATLPLKIYQLMGSYRVDEALASALLLSLLAFGSFAFFDKLGRIL
jgi:thiamine transport system permease protein